MAKILLNQISHSYTDPAAGPVDWALKNVDLTWQDGGAYALLGPSGCGKTTLLNIISGLIKPTKGQVLFDDRDVTDLSTDQRDIAQVFQFPVVYDTMSVYDNLAFPLRNRGVEEKTVAERVKEIAEMLDLESTLKNRAAGLTADSKQKISLGRGLVRSEINAILFDEPLTVIDPHLKWQLRSKLKILHQQLGNTMIYVTHDQTEALTFADKVVVIHEGEVVQVGTPVELFENPKHTFVGHFIGSPGMNLIPCRVEAGVAYIKGHKVPLSEPVKVPETAGNVELGVRPEFIKFSDKGIPAQVTRVDDVGRYRIVEALVEKMTLKVVVADGTHIPESQTHLVFDECKSHLYADGWVLGAGGL
ncbi:MAG: ABC transporter ATP-binding protein [Proteobacteria bacterium]|nr:ABC transporter ATP-binding protein [Pseudomonadota bacterium]